MNGLGSGVDGQQLRTKLAAATFTDGEEKPKGRKMEVACASNIGDL